MFKDICKLLAQKKTQENIFKIYKMERVDNSSRKYTGTKTKTNKQNETKEEKERN